MARKTKQRRPSFPSTHEEFENLVGWMGVSVRVPEDWSPVTVSAEGANGYLKVVSPDTRVLEIKWEEKKGAVSVPDALERYRKKLERTARKSRQELTWRLRPRGAGGVRPRDQAALTYYWEADRAAMGVIWHCGESNRMVIAELIGELGDDLSIAPTIFRSVLEHSREGWNDWGMDGLAVQIPETYRLEKHVRMSGNLRLDFTRGGRELHVERWGLAKIVLRDADLLEWFQDRDSKTLSRLVYEVEEIEVNGHPAFRLRGREKLMIGFGRVLKSVSRLGWPAFFYRATVWSCPESNRIYALSGMERRRDETVQEVIDRLQCHN